MRYRNRPSPHAPIFDVKKKTGAITVGNTPGAPPAPSLAIIGNLFDGTLLDSPGVLAKTGDHCYVMCGGNRMTVVDVSTPATPTIAANLVNSGSFSVALGIDAAGPYCYVTNWVASRLSVVDVSTPTTPAVVGTVTDTTALREAIGVVVDGDYCYVASDRVTIGQGGIGIVDVSVPTAPVVVGQATYNPGGASASGIVKIGNFCYVTAASSPGSLAIFDVTNPATPSLVSSHTGYNVRSGLAGSGTTLYSLSANSDELAVIDISGTPTTVGTVSGTELDGAHEAVIDGTIVYVTARFADSVVAVDVGTPASPAVVTTLVDGTNLDGASGIIQDGSFLYVTAENADRFLTVEVT